MPWFGFGLRVSHPFFFFPALCTSTLVYCEIPINAVGVAAIKVVVEKGKKKAQGNGNGKWAAEEAPLPGERGRASSRKS